MAKIKYHVIMKIVIVKYSVCPPKINYVIDKIHLEIEEKELHTHIYRVGLKERV